MNVFLFFSFHEYIPQVLQYHHPQPNLIRSFLFMILFGYSIAFFLLVCLFCFHISAFIDPAEMLQSFIEPLYNQGEGSSVCRAS